MGHAEKFADDPRTPQQLAKAILEHEFSPAGSDGTSAVTFGELLEDYVTDNASDPELIEAVRRNAILVELLMDLKENTPLSSPAGIACALEVLGGHRQDSEFLRASMSRRRLSVEDIPDPNDIEAAKLLLRPFGSFEPKRRDDQDYIGDRTVEVINLKSIEKLVRALAKKLNIELIEPERGR